LEPGGGPSVEPRTINTRNHFTLSRYGAGAILTDGYDVINRLRHRASPV